MTLRIIDATEQFEAAIARLETALRIWGGGESQAWRAGPPASAAGVSFSRREDLYLLLERDAHGVRLGAALADGDRDLLCVSLPRGEPASDRGRFALAEDDEDGRAHLLISVDALKAQNVREPFGRLAGVRMIKRARVGERDYVLVGPLDAPPVGDALLALAGLSPLFERHVETLAAFGQHEALYAPSRGVTVRHRARVVAVEALRERLADAGFVADVAETGALSADFAMSRGAETVVFAIVDSVRPSAFAEAVGRLALTAPPGAGLHAALLLPAGADSEAALGPFAAALTVLGVAPIHYDFVDAQIAFTISAQGAALPEELAAAIIAG